jgi:hypothetical protein
LLIATGASVHGHSRYRERTWRVSIICARWMMRFHCIKLLRMRSERSS